jgi:bifunctional non-homologous end joining protein LigD
VVSDADGISCFQRLRSRQHDDMAYVYDFDLLALDGDDLGREPLLMRKTLLSSTIAAAGPGLRYNGHISEHDGCAVFAHACKLGPEGIVSKRIDAPYRSGRSRDWIKTKNPDCPAARRGREGRW